MLTLNNPTPEQVTEACKGEQPVLIRGMLPQWHDVMEWTPDYLAKHYGDTGEILFVPAYWWHAVKNLSATVAVGLRYETVGSLLNKTPDY